MNSILHCLTAGVRVDLTGADCLSGAHREALELVRQVAANLIVDPAAGPAQATVDVRAVELPLGADAEQIAARWVYAVHLAALANTSTLPIHAAALAGPSGCVVLPGPSGAGKSTLAAAALQQGLRLVSDEAACFTDPVGTVLPHARPLKLARDSRRLLGAAGSADPDVEVALSPADFGHAANPSSRHRCVAVLVPQWASACTAAVEPATRSEVLAALLQAKLQADARLWPPERVWAYLTHLVSQVRVGTLRFDDPQEGARQLVAILEPDQPALRTDSRKAFRPAAPPEG